MKKKSTTSIISLDAMQAKLIKTNKPKKSVKALTTTYSEFQSLSESLIVGVLEIKMLTLSGFEQVGWWL